LTGICRQRRAEQFAQLRDIGGAACIGEETVMADAVKTLWQDMEQEAADELVRRDDLLLEKVG
jgi:hypothetical protein